MKIRVRLERDEDGVVVATCPSLPGCISQGNTEREALAHMKEAIRLHIRALAQDALHLFGGSTVKETLLEVSA